MNKMWIHAHLSEPERGVLHMVFEHVTRSLGLQGVTVWVVSPENWKKPSSLGFAVSGEECAIRHAYGIESMAITLAHELRHCWQFRSGFLAFAGQSMSWKGQVVKNGAEPYETDAEEYAVRILRDLKRIPLFSQLLCNC